MTQFRYENSSALSRARHAEITMLERAAAIREAEKELARRKTDFVATIKQLRDEGVGLSADGHLLTQDMPWAFEDADGVTHAVPTYGLAWGKPDIRNLRPIDEATFTQIQGASQ